MIQLAVQKLQLGFRRSSGVTLGHFKSSENILTTFFDLSGLFLGIPENWKKIRPPVPELVFWVFVGVNPTHGVYLVAFLCLVLSLKGGKVENGGTIFSLIKYLANFIFFSNHADYQRAKKAFSHLLINYDMSVEGP